MVIFGDYKRQKKFSISLYIRFQRKTKRKGSKVKNELFDNWTTFKCKFFLAHKILSSSLMVTLTGGLSDYVDTVCARTYAHLHKVY